MARAAVIRRNGGPEVFEMEDVPVGPPGPGQVRIRQTACGVNFLDTYLRSGQYPMRQPFPTILGGEGAGIIEAVGKGARGWKEGDRVVYSGQQGSYCDERLVAVNRLAIIPAGVSEVEAAAIYNKALTAEYLIRRSYKVKPGETILVHAAAGGVGLILCQWGKHLGATVIGTVGTEAKAAMARANGCDHTILYNTENFAERARELTNGAGVSVVYDSVGKDTFERSMDALRPLGYLVCFGESSGPAPQIDPRVLMYKGSIFLTRASLIHYNITPADHRRAARTVFDLVTSGALKINLNRTYPLADVAQAHRDIEGRLTMGATVLVP
jgi:NADPH:quinone reductase